MPKTLDVVLYIRGWEMQKQKQAILHNRTEDHIVRVVSDSDATEISPSSIEQILTLANEKKIQAVVIHKPDALTLDEEKQAYFFKLFQDAGLEVINAIPGKYLHGSHW